MNLLKYKIWMFLFFITILLLVNKADSHYAVLQLPLLGKTIYLDPGHGGRDPGTIYNNIKEKDLNLEISLQLQQELEKKGAIVFLTRDVDRDYSHKEDKSKKRGDLSRRIDMIEKANSDMYLSIHLNWYKNSYYSGAEVLYNDINDKNKILADNIMTYLKKDLKSTRHITPTNLYMYQNIKIPGVLIECGFLSNDSERNKLQQKSYQKKIGKVITKGIIAYYQQHDTT